MTSYLTVVSAFGRLCGHTTQLTTVTFLFVVFGFPLGFTLGFYFAYLYMLISHVRKELSHSDWLFVCKPKTNP